MKIGHTVHCSVMENNMVVPKCNVIWILRSYNEIQLLMG